MNYESVRTVASKTFDGVSFSIAKVSFGRRLELTKRVSELGQRLEFHQAGTGAHEQVDAALLVGDIERLYLEWGLVGVEGLEIDGKAADAACLMSAGPEELAREIILEIKRECSLSEDERKN